MLKAFHLGVALALLQALAAIILARPLHLDLVLPNDWDSEAFLGDEGGAGRSERSANISHIVGASRKIQIIVNKHMYLQVLPDGTVNGTEDDNDYTILQRSSVNNLQIKIQGVATCNYLCMDQCGLLYGSKEFNEECIFNEIIEIHHFNTYSSAKYSNDNRTLYLALNRKGAPRKVQTKAKTSLGKLITYTNVLTKSVPKERVEALAMRILKARVRSGKFLLTSVEDSASSHHSLRHHGYNQLCPNGPVTNIDENKKFRCRKKGKRKKKRKCRDDGDESDDCQQILKKKPNFTGKKKCEEGEEEEECQKRLHMIRKKRKSRNGEGDDTKNVDVKNLSAKEKNARKRRLKPEKKKASERVKKSKCVAGCAVKKVWNKKKSQDDMSWNDRFVAQNSSEMLTTSEPTTERGVVDDYEVDPTTESLDGVPEEDVGTDALYDWTTSSAVHD